MNMEAQSALDALGRLFSRRDSEGRWAAALRGAVSALMAFVLALVRAGGGAPFAIALTAAAGTDWTGIGALLGAALGYLVGGGLGWGIRYLAACVLLFTVRTVFQEFEFGRRPLFMPFAALCVTALTAFLANFSLSLGTAPDSAKLLLESSLASACTFFYRCALFPDKDLSESGEIRRSISRTVLGASLLMALVPLRLFDVLCVGRVLALIVLMASALKGGMLTGAAAGTVLGIAMDLASDGRCFFAMTYAFAGMLSGVFCRHSRLVFTLSFVLSAALAVTCAWSAQNSTPALFEGFAASVLFILLPSRFAGSVGMLLREGEQGRGERDLRRYVAGRVRTLSEAYSQLYEIVEKSLNSTQNDANPATVYDRAADRVCIRCVNKNRCWNAEYMDTLSALNDASEAIRKNGTLAAEDIPMFFRSQCININAFVGAVNAELRAMNYRRELRQRLEESRSVAWGQYADMAGMLAGVADELGSVNGSDLLAEQRLARYLRSLDIDSEVSVYRDGRGRLRATMESGSLAPLLSDAGYLNRLSQILGVRLCLPQGAEESSARLTVLEAEPLAVSVGIAALKKRGEKVSGDKGSYFKTDSGVLCVILSDGMGTGDEAARDSAQVVAILERFLRAGLDGAAAMKALNSALLLRDGENWGFATADLMCIDLFSGETCFYKYGAAPSYVRSGKTVRRINCETLAAGLSLGGGIAPDVVRMKLAPGSTALIASDGVIADGEDEWVKSILLRGTEDMKALAKSALQEAETLYGSSDDMTVVTVRVEERA